MYFQAFRFRGLAESCLPGIRSCPYLHFTTQTRTSQEKPLQATLGVFHPPPQETPALAGEECVWGATAASCAPKPLRRRSDVAPGTFGRMRAEAAVWRRRAFIGTPGLPEGLH